MAAATLSRWTPTFSAGGVMSMLNPFAIDDSAKDTPLDATDPAGKKRAPLLTTIPIQDADALRLPSSSRSSSSTMFAEPESRHNSDAGSREGSIAGGTSKRNNRPKTRFSVCHPPPTSTTRQRLHRRPRSILQLHVLSSTARPRPAFDVIHAASFSVHLTRAVARCFTAKHSICPNDLLVMRAEKYSTEEEDDDDQEARDIIGLICKGKKEEGGVAGRPKIHLRSGMEWEASQLPNGGYEFCSTDEHGLGLTVRWVQKRQKDGNKPRDKRFNFSTISPNSRRHPIIANLSQTSLEINDRYKMPDPCAVTPLSTPKQSSTILADAMDEDEAGGPDYHETDDLLREIITMTSIWVTFKEGWSPTVKYDDKDKDPTGLQRSASMSTSPGKALAAGTPPGSPGKPTLDKRNSIKSVSSSLFRRSSMLSKGHRVSASTITVDEQLQPDMQDSVSRTNSIQKTGRARGDSTSTVLVHRAASNRQKRNQQSSWQADFLTANETLPEVSREELSSSPARPRKSLAQPDPESESDDEDDDVDEAQASSTEPRVLASRSTLATHAQPLPTKTSMEKRGSSTTTDTTSSGNGPPKSSANTGSRKRSAWRKLLCGASRNDE